MVDSGQRTGRTMPFFCFFSNMLAKTQEALALETVIKCRVAEGLPRE